MKWYLFCSIWVCLWYLPKPTYAQITPTVKVDQFYPGGSDSHTYSLGQPFDLAIVRNDVNKVLIRVVPHSVAGAHGGDIGRISIINAPNVVSDGAIRIYVANQTLLPEEDAAFYVETLGGTEYGCMDWGGIEDNRPESTGGPLYLKAYVKGNLFGDIVGPIVNEQRAGIAKLNTLEAGEVNQDSDGNIFAKVWASGGTYRVRCRDASPVGQAVPEFVSDSDIALVRAHRGNLRCSITAGENHSIVDIDVPNGQVGTSLTDRIGGAGADSVAIGRIVAGRGIYGRINALGGIGLVRTTGIPAPQGDAGDFGGQITASALVDQSLGVGGMIDIAGALTGLDANPENGSITLTEGLPSNASIRIGSVYRGPNPVTDWSARIKIAPNESSPLLRGQIIINANGTGDEPAWARMIQISDGLFLGPANGTAPYYAELSSDLGGGAIGVVPFHLHDHECSPPNSESSPGSMLVSEFVPTVDQNGDPIAGKDIDLITYGPVRTEANSMQSDQPLIFELQLPGNAGYLDQTSKVDITMKRPGVTGYSRTMTLKGRPGESLMPGLYRVRPRLTGTSRLYCDQLQTSSPPSVADFEYWVVLVEDCNRNGIDDAIDVAMFPWFDDWGLDGGFGADGRIDLCEWCTAGGDRADWNMDGFVNGNDFDDFTAAFQAGDIQADFDYNGFLNGDDFDLFVAYFAVGEGC